MSILILGSPEDDHASHLHQRLNDRGVANYYLDTRWFPSRISVSWSPKTGGGLLNLGEIKLPLATIQSVFWRSFLGVQMPHLPDGQQAFVAEQDAISLLRSILQVETIHWVNSWVAYQYHKEKPRQLRAVHELGVEIPATLVSNDPIAVQTFAAAYEQVIFKPVYGGAHTQTLTSEHLHPDRLARVLKIAPATFQEYIPGTNVRSYVIGEQVYSAEVRSPQVDFREDEQAEILPMEISASMQAQCRAIAHCLMLEWTAIDWRVTPSGQFFFLEANPSPMFIYFEQKTGFPITQDLIELLVQ
ncbi:MAG: hypothetical protein B0A82_18125 [Alkalinema sp. CACIAM 70d]|nr:MAG: hypothetical protein B0A82_18125 [Alkalinema sp. CACIAM 70d]